MASIFHTVHRGWRTGVGNAVLAQLAEHRLAKAEVTSSTLVYCSNRNPGIRPLDGCGLCTHEQTLAHAGKVLRQHNWLPPSWTEFNSRYPLHGSLAQWQSSWFTPNVSGVRSSHDPLVNRVVALRHGSQTMQRLR